MAIQSTGLDGCTFDRHIKKLGQKSGRQFWRRGYAFHLWSGVKIRYFVTGDWQGRARGFVSEKGLNQGVRRL